MSEPGRATSISHFLPLFLGFGILGILLLGIFGFLQQQARNREGLHASLAARQLLSQILIGLQDSEIRQRGFPLTADQSYLASYIAAQPEIASDLNALGSVANDASIEPNALVELRGLVDRKLADLRAIVELKKAGRNDESLAMFTSGAGAATMDLLRAHFDALIASQTDRARERLNWTTRVGDWLRFAVLAALLLAAGLAYLAVARLRETLADLASANADLVSARGDLSSATAEIAVGVEREARLSEQLRQSRKMEAIGELTGGLAHDFNNILAAILGSLNLTKRRLARGDRDVVRYLDSAQDGAERATKLTNLLLAFSRPQPLAPVALDPNRMVAGMAELFRGALSDNVVLETILAGDLWRALADPNQLESAILNLAINAKDAMPEGGNLTIETSNAFLDADYALTHLGVAAGQYVLISVTDTGVGMTRDVLTKAFDPFFTTKTPGKGAGLGLSQVHDFVKQSGGHVAVYSEPGLGATVKVYLPRSCRENEAPGVSRIAANGFRAHRTSEVVLVAEDDARVIQLTVAMLRELGYTVLHADSGAAALLRLETAARVDLLFTDIVMPGMDGRKLAEEALKRQPDLRVLFTTGYAPNSVVHNGALGHGEDLISKPYSLDQLAAKIRDVLDRPRMPIKGAPADKSMPAAGSSHGESKTWKP